MTSIGSLSMLAAGRAGPAITFKEVKKNTLVGTIGAAVGSAAVLVGYVGYTFAKRKGFAGLLFLKVGFLSHLLIASAGGVVGGSMNGVASERVSKPATYGTLLLGGGIIGAILGRTPFVGFPLCFYGSFRPCGLSISQYSSVF